MTDPAGWREQAQEAFWVHLESMGYGWSEPTRDALKAALDVAEPLIRAEADKRRIPGSEMYMAGAAAERERFRQVIDPSKIEWMIHAFDLIDGLMVSRGMEANSEVQDDLRKLADLIEGDDQ